MCALLCALICVLSSVCSHMCALTCVLSCVCSYMCSLICALICQLFYVHSYVCSHVCAFLCAVICVLSYVCFHVLSYVSSSSSSPPLFSSPIAPPHCLGSLAGIIFVCVNYTRPLFGVRTTLDLQFGATNGSVIQIWVRYSCVSELRPIFCVRRAIAHRRRASLPVLCQQLSHDQACTGAKATQYKYVGRVKRTLL